MVYQVKKIIHTTIIILQTFVEHIVSIEPYVPKERWRDPSNVGSMNMDCDI